MKENQQIEFKQAWRDEYLQYLCGVANAHWGRGFDKVQVAFEINNIPFPQVENQFGGTSIYIQREAEAQETKEETTQKSTLKGTSKKIVDIVEGKPNVTIPQVAELLQMNVRGIAKHFQKLQQQGILRRIGLDKGGHWEIIKE